MTHGAFLIMIGLSLVELGVVLFIIYVGIKQNRGTE